MTQQPQWNATRGTPYPPQPSTAGPGPDPQSLATVSKLVTGLLALLIAVVVARLVAQAIRLLAVFAVAGDPEQNLAVFGGGTMIALLVSVVGLVLVLVLMALAVWAAVLAEGKGRIGAIIMAATPVAWWVFEAIIGVILGVIMSATGSSHMIAAGTSVLSPILTLGFAAVMVIGWTMLRSWRRSLPA